jgi:hypothetical protein
VEAGKGATAIPPDSALADEDLNIVVSWPGEAEGSSVLHNESVAPADSREISFLLPPVPPKYLQLNSFERVIFIINSTRANNAFQIMRVHNINVESKWFS